MRQRATRLEAKLRPNAFTPTLVERPLRVRRRQFVAWSKTDVSKLFNRRQFHQVIEQIENVRYELLHQRPGVSVPATWNDLLNTPIWPTAKRIHRCQDFWSICLRQAHSGLNRSAHVLNSEAGQCFT